MELFLIFTRESVSLASQGRYGKTYPCLGTTKMCWNERPSIQAEEKDDALLKAKQMYFMRVKVVSQAEYMNAHEGGQFDWNKLLQQSAITVNPVKPLAIVTLRRGYEGNARGVRVSRHAIEQYRDRSGSTETDKEISDRLLHWLEVATEVEAIKYYGVIALINHGFKSAKYYQWRGNGGWVMVVSEGMLATIHRGEAGRWQEKKVGPTPIQRR